MYNMLCVYRNVRHVVMEIAKHISVSEPEARLHFLRTHTGLEIDGLLTLGLRQLPFEIKAATSLREEDGRALVTYLNASKQASCGIVFYRGRECRRLAERVLAVPVTALLL
jgi:hypothetical protein